MLLTENRLFAQISHFFIDNTTLNKKEIDKSVVLHSSGHFITKMESYLCRLQNGAFTLKGKDPGRKYSGLYGKSSVIKWPYVITF